MIKKIRVNIFVEFHFFGNVTSTKLINNSPTIESYDFLSDDENKMMAILSRELFFLISLSCGNGGDSRRRTRKEGKMDFHNCRLALQI